MSNPTLFCLRRGDVVLNSATLTRIQNGSLVLYLMTENGETRLDAPAVTAILAGTKTVKVLHSVAGHRSITAATLNALT
jgi:hypothetical protein